MLRSDRSLGRLGKTYRWDLLRQVDLLGNRDSALLDGAFEIDVLHLLAQVGLGVDQLDVAVLDGQRDPCAVLDVLLDDARGVDCQGLAAVCNQNKVVSFLVQ